MHLTHIAPLHRRACTLAIALAGLALAGCSDDGDGGTGPAAPRTFNQIQRLGNPLVSEVLPLAFRRTTSKGVPRNEVGRTDGHSGSWLL